MSTAGAKLITILRHEVLRLIDRMEVFLSSEHEALLFTIRLFFENMKPEAIMNHAITRILPHMQKITDEDENFFHENMQLFGELPKQHVKFYSEALKKGLLTPAQKKEVFKFFLIFATCAEEYKKKM